ncbi:hypothetical protein VPH35_051779 [Triticum aestivum]
MGLQRPHTTPRPTPLLPSTTTVLTIPPSRLSFQMPEPRSQTPPSTTTPTTPQVPTTTCSPLTTTRSSLGGSQAGGLRLFRSVSQFVLAFLRQTCLTYVCT